MTWLRCFLWNSNVKRLSLPTGEAAKGEVDAFVFTYHSFIHLFDKYLLSTYYAIRPCILMDLTIVEETSGDYLLFQVSRSALKPVSPLSSVFLPCTVKSVNRSFIFYLLLSFDNLEAELKTCLLILATNDFWILLISRTLDLFFKPPFEVKFYL